MRSGETPEPRKRVHISTAMIKLLSFALYTECLLYFAWKVPEVTLHRKKGKVLPITGHEGPEGEQRYSPFMTSALRWGSAAPRPGLFTPGKDPVLIAQDAGWAQGPVWTGAENLTPTGIRSPDRPARSESLHWLSYPDPFRLHRYIPTSPYPKFNVTEIMVTSENWERLYIYWLTNTY